MNDFVTILTAIANTLICILIAVVVLFVLASLTVRAYERNKVKGLAKVAYHNARGTRHKKVLVQASKHIIEKIKLDQAEIARLTKEKVQTEANLQKALRERLARHLVARHLRDVSGIGQTRYKQIQQKVFKGNLDDLRQASALLPGIGQQTQFHIDQWVNKQKQQFETMLQQGFKGSKTVTAEYQPKIQQLQNQIARLQLQIAPWEAQRLRIKNELSWLNQVLERDFYEARSKKKKVAQVAPEKYLQGVFPAWEPIPEWFAAAVEGRLPAEGKVK